MTKSKLDKIFDELENQSPRTTAIVAGTLIEGALERRIESYLCPLGKNQHKKVFGWQGPLGTFACKIIMAHAMGIISDKMRTNLKAIKDIRNTFAHDLIEETTEKSLDFSSRSVLKDLNKLKIKQATETDPRNKFIQSVLWCYVKTLEQHGKPRLTRIKD